MVRKHAARPAIPAPRRRPRDPRRAPESVRGSGSRRRPETAGSQIRAAHAPLVSSLRSASSCRSIAVDDSARPRPMTRRPSSPRPNVNRDRRRSQSRWRSSARCRVRTRSAHHPQALRRKLQADHEQHEDDAEFGNLADLRGVADQTQARRSDQGAGGEVAETAPSRQRLASGTAMTVANNRTTA